MYGIIYRASLDDGRSYIGQTIKTLCLRAKEHKRDAEQRPKSNYFYNAVKKYGFDKFTWEILMVAETKDDLDAYEEYYMTLFDTRNQAFGFNLKSGGSYGKHSERTKKKMSDSHKGIKFSAEHKKSLSKAGKGRIFSEDHKKKISEASKGRMISEETREKLSKVSTGNKNAMFGRKHSEETRKKMSEARKGNKNKLGSVGHKHSEETKMKISETLKNKKCTSATSAEKVGY